MRASYTQYSKYNMEHLFYFSKAKVDVRHNKHDRVDLHFKMYVSVLKF